MISSNEMCVKWFQEFYYHEFPEISIDRKNEIIEEVLMNNFKYITKQMVLDFDGCNKCGRCCESQRCPDWDKETKLCTRHDNPIHQFCIDYPWGGDFGIAPITINCAYQRTFFIKFFDDLFKKEVDNLE